MVEAALERFDIKKAVMENLDRVCRSETILATNTSSISVTRIASTSKIPGRVIGMHFFNPAPIMQLVEIIRAPQTTDATCDTIAKLTEDIGKKAHVSKDSYGFVVNRVLAPMVNDAINCLYEGLASPEDVDQMMKLGANHQIGPPSLAELIGLDTMETLYNGFDDSKYRPSPLLKQMCDAGYLGRKTGKGSSPTRRPSRSVGRKQIPRRGKRHSSVPVDPDWALPRADRTGALGSGTTCRFRRGKARSPLEDIQEVCSTWEAVRLSKHRRRMARNEALLVGRDDPDGDR